MGRWVSVDYDSSGTGTARYEDASNDFIDAIEMAVRLGLRFPVMHHPAGVFIDTLQIIRNFPGIEITSIFDTKRSYIPGTGRRDVTIGFHV